ncbi:meprin A subunit beta-like [Fundulus diaphanus]
MAPRKPLNSHIAEAPCAAGSSPWNPPEASYTRADPAMGPRDLRPQGHPAPPGTSGLNVQYWSGDGRRFQLAGCQHDAAGCQAQRVRSTEEAMIDGQAEGHNRADDRGQENPEGKARADVGNVVGGRNQEVREPPLIRPRSSIFPGNGLWTSPVPYVLDESLDLNAKGVIMRAFDQFRVKSCIDFKPWDAEEYYIEIQKLDGCWSNIGRLFANGQNLSIGAGCDNLATVEHEILHALGFYHEQSRYDRDDYVQIALENIITGQENNFIKVGSNESITHRVPYDYMSVMHYGKDAFTNGNGSTIITTDPQFQQVIGQRLGMSPRDVQELNVLYNCNQKKGYFIHTSTASGQEGDTTQLKSDIMRPSRKCNVQCLQFYYFHTGNESDKLNIWIREFQDQQDTTGTLRCMGQLTGPPTSHWKIYHVSLDATKLFQVVFEVQKGAGSSTGGFSIDDINLSETECPHLTWQVDDFEKLLNTSDSGTRMYSPRQYSREGYAYRVAVILYQTYFGMFLQLLSGEYDEQLEWPCLQKQITFQLLDQSSNMQLQMSKQMSFTTNENDMTSNAISCISFSKSSAVKSGILC